MTPQQKIDALETKNGWDWNDQWEYDELFKKYPYLRYKYKIKK